MLTKKYRKAVFLILLFAGTCLVTGMGNCQKRGMYPPFTKWYQDPLGLKPLELSSVPGFLWSAATIAASLIFTKKDPEFQKNRSAYYETGFYRGYKSPYTNGLQTEMGIMYDIRKWMSVGLGLNALHFKDQTNNTWCFGIRPFARWYIYSNKKTSLFFEYGAGLSYSLEKFPLTGTGWQGDTARTGTKFNLTSKYGIGFLFHFSNKLSLQSGIRHFHLSNGNIAGIQRNPSHDSNGFFLGFVFKPNGCKRKS